MVLQDLLKEDLDIVFCGTAAGNKSAELKLYYAGKGNKFYSILYQSKLIPVLIKPAQYTQLIEYNIGLTDIVKNASGNDSDLRKKDFDVSCFIKRIEKYQPRIVCFNGKAAASVFFFGKINKTPLVDYGVQEKKIGSTLLYVAPSTSGSANGSWDESYWLELKSLIKKTL